MLKQLPISLKSKIKIFINHFHKTPSPSNIKEFFGVNFVLFFQIIPLHTTSHPKSTMYTFYKFSGSLIMTCWAKIRHIYFNRSITMVSLHCGFWGDWSTCWKFKKVKCFLCLMAQDGLPSSQADFLPPGASHPYSGESSSCLLCHLMTREEVGFTRKTCLAWRNSSIFLLSEKNGGEKWFHDNLSLSINFKFSLKPEIGWQIHDEAEEVRHLETTFLIVALQVK